MYQATFITDGGDRKHEPIEDLDHEHDHQFLDEDLDPYPAHDPDWIGGMLTGDICPRCGVALRSDEEVVSYEGERGTVHELAPEDASIPLYHRDCWVERRAEANEQETTSIDDFM